jgi:hypothetical protein
MPNSNELSAEQRASMLGLSECAPMEEVNKSVRARNVLMWAGVKVGAFKGKSAGFEIRATAGDRYRGFPRAQVAAAVGLPASATDRELDIAVKASQDPKKVVRAAEAMPNGPAQPAGPSVPALEAGHAFVADGGVGVYAGESPTAVPSVSPGILTRAEAASLVERGLLPVTELHSARSGIPRAFDERDAA